MIGICVPLLHFLSAVVFSNLLFLNFLSLSLLKKIETFQEIRASEFQIGACLDNFISVLEVNHERILFHALFIFMVKIFRPPYIALASIKEAK